jgi:hypothetical protein
VVRVTYALDPALAEMDASYAADHGDDDDEDAAFIAALLNAAESGMEECVSNETDSLEFPLETQEADPMFRQPLVQYTPFELVAARSRIDLELQRQERDLRENLRIVTSANGKIARHTPDTSPTGRKRRKDRGLPRVPKESVQP